VLVAQKVYVVGVGTFESEVTPGQRIPVYYRKTCQPITEQVRMTDLLVTNISNMCNSLTHPREYEVLRTVRNAYGRLSVPVIVPFQQVV
jgi:hypothetical protein